MKLLRCALASALFLWGTVAPSIAAPSAYQVVRCADLVAAVAAGNLAWASGAQTCTSNNLIIKRPTFVAWIANNGSCAAGASSAYYTMTYGDMLNCKSGGSVMQQSANASFLGGSTFNNVHGACQVTQPVLLIFTTTSAVAPTSSGTQVEWDGSGNNTGFTLTIGNPSGTTVATFSVPANSSSSYAYSNAAAAGGVYSVRAAGLMSYTCPGIGTGQHAYGTLKWYQ